MANKWVIVAVICIFSSSVTADGVLDLSNGRYKVSVLSRSDLLKHGDPGQWSEINLSGNQIDEINDNTFLGFEHLKKLSIASNSLPTIEDNWFKGSKLQSLDLSSNLLVAIRSGAFSGLTDLQELNLGDNLLRPLKSNTFDHTPHLKTLIMKHNVKFQSMFLNVTIPSLETLNLQSCRITNITSLQLEHLPNLKKIDLSNNSIDHLDDAAFTGNLKLEEVDLRGNYLDELRGNDLKKAFSPNSKVVLHFDLNNDTCINCRPGDCDSDRELQTFICQNPRESTFKDTLEWMDTEKDIKVTLKAHPVI